MHGLDVSKSSKMQGRVTIDSESCSLQSSTCPAVAQNKLMGKLLINKKMLANLVSRHKCVQNYRCVLVFGKAREVTDSEEKAAALLKLTEHIIPGRTQHARAASDKELSQTAVLAVDLTEVSAKVCALHAYHFKHNFVSSFAMCWGAVADGRDSPPDVHSQHSTMTNQAAQI